MWKSIRFRLVLWYMLILSVTLFLFGVVLYHNFSHRLKMDMDDLLRSRTVNSLDIDAEAKHVRADMRAAMHNLSLLLILLLPLTVILTGVAGAFLANVALSPVHKMIATIHQITAENLRLRLELPHSRDEIHALAVTFNEMLVRLDDAFTSQRQFMEDISHELKTPLAVLKGELEVTLKKVRSPSEYESILLSSLEEVNHLAKMVENLLTLARFDTKTVTLETERVNLNELLQSVLDDIKVLAEQKDIVLEFHSQKPLSVVGDRSQLRRVLLNLLDNAIKYTPDRGMVSMDLWRENNSIKIRVSDTGVGVPQQELGRIFDRFYRVDKSRGGQGFGLGLSIAKSIVEAHHGDIEVTTVLNKGSQFTVTLKSN